MVAGGVERERERERKGPGRREVLDKRTKNECHELKTTRETSTTLTNSILSHAVHVLGGRRDLRLQPGERDELQRDLQLLRQNVAVQEHGGDTDHPRRHAR